ncbi:outer membrane beta-barrel protein [Methylobacterium sp. C25]|uniref:outer membrane protein n=1 Tax=Methylobacterium sp. C25 TaxID=2721622 RepID=UPI001F1AE974|nr:porin family protein [Methylobacterium sp. C25]MCE4222614.1 outer membrane beta-barrel protein [Methylobacterium sp. C25]
MKSFLRATTAFAAIALAGSAFAADLPRRAAPPPVFTPVPVFTWTGFYAGFNAGYGFGTSDNNGPTVLGVNGASTLVLPGTTAAIAFPGNRSNDGFVGGGQIGYNYQFTPGSGFVIGVEADAQYADFGRERNRFVSTGPLAAQAVFNPNGLSGLDYFGTVRGRLGYAFDRTLVYGTGGFAYGSGGGSQFGTGVSSNDFQTGWVAGGGIEYALPTDSFLNFFRSSAVTLKVEGLYVNLDRNSNASAGAFAVNNAGALVTTSSPGVVVASGGSRVRDTEFAVVRAGINYKFGSY